MRKRFAILPKKCTVCHKKFNTKWYIVTDIAIPHMNGFIKANICPECWKREDGLL